MDSLRKKAFTGLLQFIIVLFVLVFLPAGSIRFLQGWIFWLVFSLSVLFITLYFLKYDPELIKRRLKAGPGAEKERSQKIIQSFATLCFLLILIIPGLDYRFSWTHLPLLISLVGDIFVALGLLIIFFVFKENTFTSGIIEINTNQKVIFTGPYAIVRHPMYAGAMLMFLGIPVALGSTVSIIFFFPMLWILIWRLLNEETFLLEKLPGYKSYCQKTTYHLIPFLW